MTVEWIGRQTVLAGRLGAAALRNVLRCRWSALTSGRFRCQLEQLIDETCPPYED